LRGLFAIAEDLAKAKIETIPKEFSYKGSPLVEIIESYRDAIIRGEIKTFIDLPPIKPQPGFWKQFNESFNFLKHANQDSGGALEVAKIKNDELLMRASAVFFEITNRVTPEIAAYYIFSASHLEDSGLSEGIKSEFANLPKSEKRRRCLAWLEKHRGSSV
jgi:hypothetical protein